jgi:ribonuclease G
VPEGGIIVRTAAEGASEEEIVGDLALLQKLWATIKGRAERTDAPALIYQEHELPLRIVRDLFIRDFVRVVVDHERTYRRIVGYLRRTSKDLADRVELYSGREPLMEAGGVDAAVRSTLDRRVDLPSGGYLIFDYAEAFTVVDVNTGRFVGARGKQSGARLEDTITKNNLEAVQEVVRQLRLRDIGGIIVIDFIDMANPKNRQSVEDALQAELEKDRTKTYVVEISPLGLVEMTRQNVTDGPREIMTVACTTCGGDGIVVSDETNAVKVERELRRLVLTSRHQGYLLELNTRVAAILIGPGASRLTELEQETGRRFFFETKDDLHSDHFAVLDRGPVSRLEAKSLPVAAGDELEVKIEKAHLQSEGDATARLNGYVIAVAGAAGKIGKTVRVRIERPTRNMAYATLAGAAEVEAPVDAGTELDREDTGEEPKRSRRGDSRGRARAKADAATADGERDGEEERTSAERGAQAPKRSRRGGGSRGGRPAQPASAEAADQAVDGGEAVVDGAPGTDSDGQPEQPKRKKTRRGSRGGRGRKKKPVTAEVAPNGEVPEAEAVPAELPQGEAEPAAPEASPNGAPPEGDSPEAPKRKKTRRGSRGGRNRRKKPAATTPEGEVGADAPATALVETDDLLDDDDSE